MKLQYLYFFLFFFSCSDKISSESRAKIDKSDFVDTTFKFSSPNDNKIVLRTFKNADSTDYLNFKYFRKVNSQWTLINHFDTIPIPLGLEFDHQDFNGDNLADFTFLADRGGRGSNFYQHLMLYDRVAKNFTFIKGFDSICAPAFDSSKNQIIGIGLSGSYRDFRYYKIQRDTIVQDSGVVFEDAKMTERYKFVKGKKVAQKLFKDTTR
jgi:hypothetical protein